MPVISPLAFFFAMASGRLTTACWEFRKSKWKASRIPTITLKHMTVIKWLVNMLRKLGPNLFTLKFKR